MAEKAEQAEAKGGGGSLKLVIIMLVGAIVLVLASMAGVFFMLKSMGMLNTGGAAVEHAAEAAAEEEKPAIYHALDPAFVVNFKDRGRTRYVQIEVQVMTRDPAVIDVLDQHMPLIRNNLLLLFSGQTSETLHSAEGKEKLRLAARAEIQRILEEKMGEPGIEELYFTSFVTQ